jgi:hypothetical protein
MFFISCASKSGRELLAERQSKSKAHYAAFDGGFYNIGREPAERPVRNWDFFYKHCDLVSRNPYPSKSEYDCSNARER